MFSDLLLSHQGSPTIISRKLPKEGNPGVTELFTIIWFATVGKMSSQPIEIFFTFFLNSPIFTFYQFMYSFFPERILGMSTIHYICIKFGPRKKQFKYTTQVIWPKTSCYGCISKFILNFWAAKVKTKVAIK